MRSNNSVDESPLRSEVVPSRPEVVDRHTEELFRQVIRARNREIQAIAAVKQVGQLCVINESR